MTTVPKQIQKWHNVHLLAFLCLQTTYSNSHMFKKITLKNKGRGLLMPNFRRQIWMLKVSKSLGMHTS